MGGVAARPNARACILQLQPSANLHHTRIRKHTLTVCTHAPAARHVTPLSKLPSPIILQLHDKSHADGFSDDEGEGHTEVESEAEPEGDEEVRRAVRWPYLA